MSEYELSIDSPFPYHTTNEAGSLSMRPFKIVTMRKTFYLTLLLISGIFLLPELVFSQDQANRQLAAEEAEAMDYYIRGIHEFENENYEQALEYLDIAYQLLPDYAGVNFALADAYFATGDLINAEYYAQKAIELDPGNKWYYLKLARIYRQSGKHETTLEVLQNALEYHPNDINLLLRLGSLYHTFKKFPESNEVYRKVLAIRGGNFDIHMRKYQNFREMDMRDSALSELDKMTQIEPENLGNLHTLSQFYMEMNQREAAMEILQKAKQRNARNPETLILMADIFIKEAKWDSLGNTFITIIEDPLISPSQKMELARFLYLEQQSSPSQQVLADQTRRVLEKFSTNEPEYGNAHLLAAEFYLNRNETSAAIEKLEMANEVMPEEADAWHQRLQLMFSAGNYEEVITTGKKAAGHIRDDAFIQFFVGSSLMLTDRHEEAVEWLENATFSPSNRTFRSVIYSTLGDAFSELDQWERASDAFESALRLDPNNHNAKNNYAYYLSLRNEKLDYAKDLALEAVGAEPENASYLDTAGWIFYKSGDYQTAYQYIQKSIDTGEMSAEVLEHMGDVCEQLGQPDEARKWWRQALNKDPNRSYLKEKINE
ncbi:MAG: tetratricopeptide repeat protein [Balneolaceae bacterium]